MSVLDWLVFGIYFLLVVILGFAAGRKSTGVEGYLMGNRRLRWWPIGLSVMATQASAITFIGTTGQAYDDGMEFIQVYLAQPLALVVVCVLFVPLFYRARIYTAYEFLERRFDAKTRSLASLLFLLSRGIAAGIVLYAPAVVLSVIMEWDEAVTILIMGGVAILYTVAGGIVAVIWTDVLQMLLGFAGIGVAILVLFSQLPAEVGINEVVYVGGIHQKWSSIDLSWDLNNPYTLWSGLFGGFFLALAYFGCDQSQVQRYLTASSLEQSRLSLLFNAFVKVPMQFFILAIGVLLFAFHHFERPPLIFNPAERAGVEASGHREIFTRLQTQHQSLHASRREATLRLLEARKAGEDFHVWHTQIRHFDEKLSSLRRRSKELVQQVRGTASSDVNYVFPSYLIRYVPPGILGLMIAVIFAAAMSSLDSEITALSSATVVDFYRRYWAQTGSDAHYLRVSRLCTLLWGIFAVAVALHAGRLGSLIEAVNRVGSYFYGSLLGVFLLGFLVRSANGTGAFWGLIIGMLSVYVVSIFTDAWLYYNVVGVAVVLLVGSFLSRSTQGNEFAK